MSFFNKFIFALFFLTFSLKADVLKDIENYINCRTGQATVQANNHCAFRNQLDLRLHLNELSPQLKTQAMALLAEPVRQNSIVSPSGHFTLYYDSSGYHAVPSEDISANGIPDYIDSALVIFDHVWDVEINQLGFLPPPALDGGAVENYHIYFTKSYQYYGWTTWDQQISGSPGNTFTSFIEINSNFYKTNFYTSGLNALKVTAAHKFNHAIQLGYNFRIDENNNYPDLFFLEMTSTWMEDYVYNEVNDYYSYLKNFIPNIDGIKFNASYNNYDYANSIYLHMLEEKFGAKIMPEIWRRIVDEEPLQAINTILLKKGSSFARSQNDYAAWLYYTGDRSIPGKYFPEALNYPKVVLKDGQEEIEKELRDLRMRHVEIELQDSILYKAKISAQSQKGLFNHISNGGIDQSPAKFGKYQTFYQRSGQEPLVVILSNPVDDVLEDIHYSVKFHKATPGPNIVHVKKEGQGLTFYNVPAQGLISIYTLNGRFLAKIRSGIERTGQVTWDMRDKFGKMLSSGIYIYIIRQGNSEIIGKFAVVR